MSKVRRVFRAPKFVPSVKQVREVIFTGTIPANTHRTIVSAMIRYSFRVTKVRITFANDHVNAVLHYWFCSHNDNRSTTAPPPDTNMFARISPNNYFVGHDQTIPAFPSFRYEGRSNYIKLHVHNTNAYAVMVSASCIFEEI